MSGQEANKTSKPNYALIPFNLLKQELDDLTLVIRMFHISDDPYWGKLLPPYVYRRELRYKEVPNPRSIEYYERVLKDEHLKEYEIFKDLPQWIKEFLNDTRFYNLTKWKFKTFRGEYASDRNELRFLNPKQFWPERATKGNFR